MKKNYCIASPLHPLEGEFDTVQFTLNGRIFPSQRRTVQMLREHPLPCDYFVHYDFIYIASRFALFAPHVQNAIVTEVVSIINHAKVDPHLKGIVMHCDFPMKSALLGKSEGKILAEYKASVWNKDEVLAAYQNPEVALFRSLEMFGNRLCGALKEFPIKVYLENTTKVGVNNCCRTELIAQFVLYSKFPCFGVCVDTEHYFAVEGSFPPDSLLYSIPADSLLIHLNAIPEEVAPGSCKDRHSATTLFECSQFPISSYMAFVSYLELKNIPYIREVYTETMLRELEQLSQHN